MSPADGIPDSSQDLRRRLGIRIGVALTLLGIVAAGLHWLDDSGTPPSGDSSTLAKVEAAAVTEPPQPAAGDVASPPATGLAAQPEPEPDPVLPNLAAAPAKIPETGEVTPPPPAPVATPSDAEPVQVEAAPTKEPPATSPVPPKPAPQARTRIAHGPHLQAGVFLQPANAEQLKTQLEAKGIPVYIESRVQVGPFANRKEAERVREQLKAMGVTSVLIMQ